MDQVDGLGSFVELETYALPEDMQQAREDLIVLAEKLGLSGGERRSYLELLFEANQRQADS